MYYHNTRHALLGAFDKNDAFYATMKWDYEDEYPSVAYSTISVEDRIAQNAIVRGAIRHHLSHYHNQLLAFCYSMDVPTLSEAWKKTIKPLVVSACSHADNITEEVLLLWVLARYSKTGYRKTPPNLAKLLGRGKSTVHYQFSRPIDKVLKYDIELAEEKVSDLIDLNEWIIDKSA